MSLHEPLSGIKRPGDLADEKMELNVNKNTLWHIKTHEYMQTCVCVCIYMLLTQETS